MANRLAQETSPYLLQHADNPVDWYPWGEEALARARAENKPILLSIGYSACHWCHVMAHESFEDEGTAALMNLLYVNVKVDREERPDLDQIYQLAHQMLTGRGGGWPLTLFLSPDGMPFMAGTYFPKAARYGLPAFEDLLKKLASAFRLRKDEVEAQNVALRGHLAATLPSGGGSADDLGEELITTAVKAMAAHFDPEFGGFGSAPKFPRPADLMLLLRHHAASGDAKARDMVLTTLRHMAAGGIFDQIGGGFFRYSVDPQWMIPHFEKMLYDNGLLLSLYADAYALSGEALFKSVVEQTVAWALAEMQAPEGGFYAALDADSEGHEGRFYVWTPDEIMAALAQEEYAVASLAWGLERPANFEGKAWHLTQVRALDEVASALEIDLELAASRLASARQKLAVIRQQRVRPGLDDKRLTSWNALMISGLARAAAVFQRPDWLAAARKAADFVRASLWQAEGAQLFATYKDGRARYMAYLDEHAFLIQALLQLAQADFRIDDLTWARQLADVLLARFEDAAQGGFYFTAHDHEALIHRPKPGFDNATPSGNGVAALMLLRLSHLSGETRYGDAAGRTLALFQEQMAQDPQASTSLLALLGEWLQPTTLVVLTGPAAETAPWRQGLLQCHLPAALVFDVADARLEWPAALNKMPQSGVIAHVCSGVSCLPPLNLAAGEGNELSRILKVNDLG